jgi:ankyrin repeat protein
MRKFEIKKLLFDAVKSGDIAQVQSLINQGADVNTYDRRRGETPVHKALMLKNTDMVKFLTDNGANANSYTKRGNDSPLHKVVYFGMDPNMFEFLVDECGVDAGRRDPRGRSLLHMAALSGKEDMIRLLIDKYGIDVNDAGGGETPLHCAIEIRREDVIKLLVNEYRADVCRGDGEGATPLEWAAVHCINTLRFLIEKGGKSVRACIENRGGRLLKCVIKGLMSGYSSGNFSLSDIDDKQATEIVNIAVFLVNEYKIDVNAAYADDYMTTPLYDAVESGGNKILIEFLAGKGADVNSFDIFGETPMHRAARSGNLETVKFLADKGADIRAIANNGETPFDFAVQNGHEDVAEFLRHVSKITHN